MNANSSISGPRRRARSDGERSREAILRTAAGLATTEGITGLSLGRLAEAVGMSKSGLFAHFGSKEELQLATIETACRIYDDVVVEPALAKQTGIERLRALTDRFFAHVEEGVFPGGCFFASVTAEVDTHPGPVRDQAIAFALQWVGHLRQGTVDAQAQGAIDPGEDPDQLAFELDAYLLLANANFVASGDPGSLERGRRAVERRLALAAPERAPKRRPSGRARAASGAA
jgi:AcrR family transcriptional regulator